MTTSSRPRLGVSSCLMGSQVRFDGGHKRNRLLTDTLDDFVDFVLVCPEVEVGMGTPRETVRLVRDDAGKVRMVAPKGGRDWTEAMTDYARARVEKLAELDLCGFVLKSGSPSCGMERVRIYDGNGIPDKSGQGLFAKALMERFPSLPVEEEGRLNDARLRENFFVRVFAYRRLRDLFATEWSGADLVEFHAREKFQLMAHDPERAKELGKLVAAWRSLPRERFEAEYESLFMAALKRLVSPSRHRHTLDRALGFLRSHLSEFEHAEIRRITEEFATGIVPLVVPITMLRHYATLYRVEYLTSQAYLDPQPRQLVPQNRIDVAPVKNIAPVKKASA